VLVALIVTAILADVAVLAVTAKVLVDAHRDRAAVRSSGADRALYAAAVGEITAGWYRVSQAVLLAFVSVLILVYVLPLWPFQTPGLAPAVGAILVTISIVQFMLVGAALAQRSTRNNIVRHVRSTSEGNGHE